MDILWGFIVGFFSASLIILTIVSIFVKVFQAAGFETRLELPKKWTPKKPIIPEGDGEEY